jgi:protein-tyrosine phosphatase
VNSLANLRDVSHGLEPGTIGEGILLRSEAPLSGDTEPRSVAWPPTTVVDLRHPTEIAESHPFAPFAVVHNVSLIDPSKPGPRGPSSDDGLRAFYGTLLAPPSAPALVTIVTIVAESEGPTLIHCLAGKDRTGVTVALILTLAGVDRDAIIHEYLLTNRVSETLLPRLRLHYAKTQRQPSPKRLTLAAIEAPLPLIVSVLDHWESHPDGARGWYLDNGGDDETIERLIRRLRPRNSSGYSVRVAKTTRLST